MPMMPPEPPAIVQTIRGLLSAANANDARAVQAYFSGDAVVIDENPPFIWRAPQAGAEWWHSVQRREARTSVASLHAESAGTREFRLDREGDDAFVETALLIHVRMRGGRAAVEHGIWTLTLHRTGAVWKVTSATWTTVAP